MPINYTLGGGPGPRKPKKTKGPMTPEEAGRISKEKRAQRFNNPKDKDRAQTAMDINTKSKKMVEDEGMKLNEYGLPAGEQKHKKLKKFNKIILPKYRKGR